MSETISLLPLHAFILQTGIALPLYPPHQHSCGNEKGPSLLVIHWLMGLLH